MSTGSAPDPAAETCRNHFWRGILRRSVAPLALLLPLAGGCTSDRPFIVTRGSALADIYVHGQVTGVDGDRWNLKLVPGVGGAVGHGADALDMAHDLVAPMGSPEFYADRGQDISNGLEFAGRIGVGTILGDGLPAVVEWTGDGIGELTSQTPFGWPVRVLGRALFGYVLAPAGLVLGSALAVVGGVGFAAVAPPVQIVGRPVAAVALSTAGGVALPAAEIVWHHAVYPVMVLNRVPSRASDDDSWLIERIESVDAVPDAPAPPSPLEPPAKPASP